MSTRRPKTFIRQGTPAPSPSLLNPTPLPPRLPWYRRRLPFFLVTFAFVTAVLLYFFWDLPNPTQLTSHPASYSTKLLDRHGKLIYEIFVNERRTPVKLSSLPDYVWQATLAAEDKDFFKHGGFSFTGIARALWRTVSGNRLEGGSTITQQLVKNALLTQDRTLRRKVREFTLSMAVELLYKKNDILEMYLNQVPYGGTAYGLESASETYFGKPATQLSIAEAALLAGLPQAPSYFSPFGSHPEQAKQRQLYVLNQMLANHFITQEQQASATAEILHYGSPPNFVAPHFSLWVKDLLVDRYGLAAVERGGLIVTTSLDLDLQQFAQNTVATEVGKLKAEHVTNGAALVTRPKTGEIYAMIGSKDYFNLDDDGNVNVTLASRQPGSSIKPLTYALGLENRLFTPATVLSDKPTCFNQPDQPSYCPQNYDGNFHGPTQVRYALGNSFNIPAVKAVVLDGVANMIASSSAFGIHSWADPAKYGPSITLGGGELTMLELSTAYSVFANDGQRVDLNPLLQVRDSTGKILDQAPLREIGPDQVSKIPARELITIDGKNYVTGMVSNTRVISAGTAFLITHILEDNGARSATFGASSYLNISGHGEVAVKTGTTNDLKDNWTIGYTPDLLVNVWVGNNDNTPMSRVASGVTGASPIWNRIMTTALKGQSSHWPTKPAEIQGTLVCSLSGLKAPENPDASCSPRYEYFLPGTIPAVDGGNRKDIPIYRPSQSPASAQQQLENPGDIEYQNHAVITDPFGTTLCLDCSGGYGPSDTIRLDRRGKALL